MASWSARRPGRLAAAVAAGLLAAGAAWLAVDAPRRARLLRALTPRRAPDRWGGPLVPCPLVSRGKRVTASAPHAERLVDGLYRGATWDAGHPTPAAPAWAAIRVGGGYARLLVTWTSSHNHDWDERFYGAPADYRIETSPDSSDGRDGTWLPVAEVADNPVRTRAHAIPFGGQRWVRLTFTRLPARVNEWGLHLDEIDVHDLSGGGNDLWVFLGDSITAGVFDRAAARQPDFPAQVARRHPAYSPALVQAGKGAMHTDQAVAWTDRLLALNPEARVVAIGIGSNDWDPAAYARDLAAIVAKVRAAGKIPVVARMPYRSDTGPEDHQARLNEVVDRLTRELGLLPGPDLYAWTRAHPERLTDHLHVDDAGAVAFGRLWAEAVDPLYE